MNRREWKKSRRTERQNRNRKIITTVIIAAGGIAIIAAIFVLLIYNGIIHVPGIRIAGNASSSWGSQTDSGQTASGEIEADGEPGTGGPETDGSGEQADSALDTEGSSDADTSDAFDRSAWLDSHFRVKGVYVTGPVAGSSRFEEILDLIDRTEINAIVLDIKNDEGIVTFDMESGRPAEIGACVAYIRDIDALLTDLKERDIYVIGRIACFKDPILAEADSECALRTNAGTPVTDGEGLAWVNPCSEQTWEYLIGIAEYCADIGFDEIQYDYVRFPVGDTAANADYGVELADSDKHTYIEAFLEKASGRLHAKGIPVSADVFGTVIGNETDVAMVGQDYAELSTRVDALCPMVYPSHYGKGVYGFDVPDAKPYDTVLNALNDSAAELSEVEDETPSTVRPWLQAFTATWVRGHISYGTEEIREQIRAVEDAGYEEWILWNAKNNYTFD